MTANFKERLGVDINQKLKLEPAIEWAAANKVRYIDVCLDPDPDLLRDGADRAHAARSRMEQEGIVLGLHTLSAVNTAEMSPFASEAANTYLETYVRAAKRLGAQWIVVHAGYHFTSDKPERMSAALARLQRASIYRGMLLASGVFASWGVHHASRRWPGFDIFMRRAPYFSSAISICIGLYVGYQGVTALA